MENFYYGYGEKEDRIINLMRTPMPDFAAAEALIAQGADLNAVSDEDPDENMLSETLFGFWSVFNGNSYYVEDDDERIQPPQQTTPQPENDTMLDVIRFFLDHGFDVHKNNGKFGAQCLHALVLSTFDRTMLRAARLLLDAGARNVASDAEGDIPSSAAAFEGGVQRDFYGNLYLYNIFEAYYHLLDVHDSGKPYQGIDCYFTCYGKRVLRVLAEKPETGGAIFPLDLPGVKQANCFQKNLYVEYEGGCLAISKYVSLWTDAALPDVSLVDVTDAFPGVAGHCIKDVSFGWWKPEGKLFTDNNTATLHMDDGTQAYFCINDHYASHGNWAAHFRILPPPA